MESTTYDSIQQFSDAEWDAVFAHAREIGGDHGENAASWWAQDAIGGRVSRNGEAEENARLVLAGIEDGDPLVLDALPQPDLSGQWAGGYLPSDLVSDLGLEDCEDVEDALMDLCEAYEYAFSDAVLDAITSGCRTILGEKG